MMQGILEMIFGNPWVIYILLILGLYLLMFGIASDEMEMTVGAVICLGISIFGIYIIGVVDLWSVLLFVVGVVLFILEAQTEASLDGVFAISGIICVISGGVVFLQSVSVIMPPDQLVIMWVTLLTFTIALAALFGGMTIKVIEIKKREPVDKFVPDTGDIGVVKSEELKPEGQVALKGEVWSAKCIDGFWPVLKGEEVKVVKIEGVHLIVRPLDSENS